MGVMPVKTVISEVNLCLWDCYSRGLWDEWGLLTVLHSLSMFVGTALWQCRPLSFSERQRAETQKVELIIKGEMHISFHLSTWKLWSIWLVSVSLYGLLILTRKGFCGRWSTLNLWGWTMKAYFYGSGAPRLYPKECSSTRGIWGCVPP